MILGLLMAVVFTVSLSETIESVDALSASASKIQTHVELGDNAIVSWKLINNSDEKIWIEIWSQGPGSEFLFFDELVELNPRNVQELEIIIAIPDDYTDNVELRPKVFALQRGEPLAEGITGATVNIQLKKTITIFIGDNPIYTAPIIEEKIVKPAEVIIPEKEAAKAKTLEEKLADIAARNAALQKAPSEVPVDDTIDEPTETQPVMDTEPTMDAEPIVESVVDNKTDEEVGGCLIATATYGSELAPQVQLLREIRDNQLMGTGSGMAFMSGFNQLYYSFSPHIADLERQSPVFKEMVKLSLTPMLSTLSVMEHAETESEVLGLGIGVILMNLGMYVGLPTFGIVKLIQFRKK